MFSKFSYPQRNLVMKNFKTKKKSPYHLSNFNSPLPLQTPPRARPRVRDYLLFALFFLVVGSGSTLFALPLFVLVSVSLEIS